MKLGYVAGTLWNGHQCADLDGCKLLVVAWVDPRFAPTGDYAVCVDAVGAGVGEWVIAVSGSSARMTDRTEHVATDHTIVGIVDRVHMPNQVGLPDPAKEPMGVPHE